MTYKTETGFAAPVRGRERTAHEAGAGSYRDAQRLCVGIATRGRPAQVQSVVEHLRGQTLRPDQIIVSCVNRSDVGLLEESDCVKIFKGRTGLARQRNVVLHNLPAQTEFVVFFDDDFYPHRDWLGLAAEAFRDDPRLACLTGNVIADGILGPGLTYDDAMRALEHESPSRYPWVIEGYSPYGCNMAFRLSSIEGLAFDERLVLYGWLEDRDFGARLAKDRGRLIKLGSAIGVHLGVKDGRVSGRRLGYSQIMNPHYTRRKQTMTTPEAMRQVLRNLSMNAAKSVWSEPYADRRGRLIGNVIAIGDILTGRCTPERAERL